MNYEQMIETLDIIEFQRRKNWYVHESTYDLLIKQLKRCKRLDEGSLLDWVPIYFVTYLFALIVFLPLTNQFTTGISLLFVLILKVVLLFSLISFAIPSLTAERFFSNLKALENE